MSKNRNKKGKDKHWSALDEVRHPVPKPGFSFKDRKRDLRHKEDLDDMRNYK